ncbi:MAG: hypothetical protein DRJ09_00495 [Bacteroidetes bacterium]|nr:MAG: hypothetical protein DRJ09_00495 [Bacteroidota bacterium]
MLLTTVNNLIYNTEMDLRYFLPYRLFATFVNNQNNKNAVNFGMLKSKEGYYLFLSGEELLYKTG